MKWASQWAFLLLLPSAYAGKRACSDASSDAEGSSEAPEAPVLPVAGTPVALGAPAAPPAAPPTVPPSSLEAVGAARAVRSACNAATSSISTSRAQAAPVSKAKSQAPVFNRSASPWAAAATPRTKAEAMACQAKAVLDRPEGTQAVPPLPPCPEGVNHAMFAGLEMYLRLVLVRLDAAQLRVAGVQADLVSMSNAMRQQRATQAEQYGDVMRRLSRCRLSQIGWACNRCGCLTATEAALPPKARPVQPRPVGPPVQPPVQSSSATNPAAKRPRGSVALQCPTWLPQPSASSSSSGSSAPASAAARFLRAEAEAAVYLAAADAAAAPPVLPIAPTDAAVLRAALPAAPTDAAAPVTPNPEEPCLEPEPGSG